MKFRNTNTHKKFWANRKIDWNESYLKTHNHPHRELISKVLSKLNWISLLEIGCGPGANLVNILTHFEGKQVGGIDINPDAIKLAEETFKGGHFRVNSVDDIMMSDKSVDIVLSDMTLIYMGDIDKAMSEIKRIARKYIVFCELHEENIFKSFFFKLKTGYYTHNYRKLLAKHGFEDIMLIKIRPEEWDGHEPQVSKGYIIIAKSPK